MKLANESEKSKDSIIGMIMLAAIIGVMVTISLLLIISNKSIDAEILIINYNDTLELGVTWSTNYDFHTPLVAMIGNVTVQEHENNYTNKIFITKHDVLNDNFIIQCEEKIILLIVTSEKIHQKEINIKCMTQQ